MKRLFANVMVLDFVAGFVACSQVFMAILIAVGRQWSLLPSLLIGFVVFGIYEYGIVIRARAQEGLRERIGMRDRLVMEADYVFRRTLLGIECGDVTDNINDIKKWRQAYKESRNG